MPSSDLLLGSVGLSFVENRAISVSRWLGARWNSPITFASSSRSAPTYPRSLPTSGSTFCTTTCNALYLASRPTFTQTSCSRSSLLLFFQLYFSCQRLEVPIFTKTKKLAENRVQKIGHKNWPLCPVNSKRKKTNFNQNLPPKSFLSSNQFHYFSLNQF